ncbi:MAG TPA: hypothetical protein VGR31_06720 [Planctomycetota bacterium]|jgi:hypothetical protein|nr:hypothetical protein [Planctomycetota bacterium]
MNALQIAKLIPCLAFLSLASIASAGASAGAPQGALSSELASRLESWRAIHGPTWQLAADVETGYAKMVYGGKSAPAFRPIDDAQFVDLARAALTESRALHGIETSSLVADRVVFLPLGQIGSSDKMTVRFHQEIGGVRVVGGYVNVLFDANGAMLSVQSTGLTDLARFATQPTVDAARALALARAAFLADSGLAAASVDGPTLVIRQELREKRRQGVLAWQIDARAEVDGAQPEGFRYWIDARDGRVLSRESTVHNFDVHGTVTSNATPGLLPDVAGNPPTQQPMKYMLVTSASGNATTDANGNFNIAGVNAPLAVTFTYNGTFNHVVNTAGANYSLTQTLPANQANAVQLNVPPGGNVTSQANAFLGVDHLRDWVRSVDPGDGTADFVATANVNLNQTCNAYYDGVSINFYAPGGGCPNTCYSTVISHEQGHWLNDFYGTGNGPDGMGEGNADVWAMYSWETPVVAQDFFGPGTFIRTGLNTRQYCGDNNPACYGEVHADGEVWMGAAWKVRAHLQTTNGNAAGGAIANGIFLGWMNAFDQGQIHSIIETQWLTLDDDDGNLGNGTPHIADINQGFVDQGFPPFIPPYLSFTAVTEIPDQTCEASSYPVSATVVANSSPPITSTTLVWRVNGGGFNNVPMTNTSGNDWTGSIPSQPSPARVQYYISATDSAAHTLTYPANAPTGLISFTIGLPLTRFTDNFETVGDNGWTHGSVGDTANNQDEWQHGSPLGRSGSSFGVAWSDPAVAGGGTRCWGIDLGIGSTDGAYAQQVHPYLRSPVINLAGAFGTRLRFKRWLTVEQGIYDQARILVNGNQVWTNPVMGHTVDTAWSTQEIDISAFADNNAAVTIQFDLRSDGGLELGGWQIDDVVVLSYTSAPACCPPPSTYCVLSPNSAGPGAVISSSGTTSVAANDFVLNVAGCPANKFGLFIYGPNQASAPYGNGVRCVANPFFRLHTVTTSGAGTATFAVDYNNLPPGQPITPGSVENFQFIFRDPAGGGARLNTSNGENATFCP